MSIREELESKETTFPKGKIVLLDGRLIDCYPLATEEVECVPGIESGIEKKQGAAFDEDVEKDLFIRNAFYFLAHRERILTDSRMFLCPVSIHQAVYGFSSGTLGEYLQWWETCAGVMRTDKKGRRSLVYQLAGSPLSGKNHCAEVYENGSTKIVTLTPFRDHYLPFVRINNLYTEAKQMYQCYTLQQVLDVLDHEEEGDMDYAHKLNEQLNSREISSLNEHIHNLEGRNAALEERCSELLQQLKEEKMLRYYESYKALEQQVISRVDALRQKKRDLKASLHRGDYTDVDYEQMIVSIDETIKEEEQRLANYRFDEIKRIFPDISISFYQIEDFVQKRKKKENENEQPN